MPSNVLNYYLHRADYGEDMYVNLEYVPASPPVRNEVTSSAEPPPADPPLRRVVTYETRRPRQRDHERRSRSPETERRRRRSRSPQPPDSWRPRERSGERHPQPREESDGRQQRPEQLSWNEYCRCTVLGHECGAETCHKVQTCWKLVSKFVCLQPGDVAPPPTTSPGKSTIKLNSGWS